MNNVVHITLPTPTTLIGGGFLDDAALRSVLNDDVVAGPAVERVRTTLAK